MKGTCPVCNLPLNDDSDVVVCPVCGAPHHRSCYTAHGGCYYESLHSSGFEYTDPNTETNTNTQNRSDQTENSAVCPSCGAANRTDSVFCSYCGTPIHMASHSGYTQPTATGGFRPGDNPFVFVQQTPIYDDNDEINGIKTKEIAEFVGTNQSYYVEHFRRFSSGKTKTSFNFPAFFCPSIFFLYRKMWIMSFISIFMSFLSMVPLFAETLLLGGQTVPVLSSLFATVEDAEKIQYIISIINTVISIGFGLFANYLYFKKTCKTVRKAHESESSDSGAVSAILKMKGGVSTVSVAVFTGCLFIFSTMLLFLLT